MRKSPRKLALTIKRESFYLAGVKDDLYTQLSVLNKLTHLAKLVKMANPAERKDVVQFHLSTCELPPHFHLPISPRYKIHMEASWKAPKSHTSFIELRRPLSHRQSVE
jgi:hypothetical protein